MYLWTDSEYLLAACLPIGVTHVFSPLSGEWSARITEGVSGLAQVQFSADSRHVLARAEHSIKITVWSLASKKVRVLKFPKAGVDARFSPHGLYLALVENGAAGSSSKDAVCIYDCLDSDWQLVSQFQPASDDAMDIAGLEWNPRGDLIALRNSPLHYLVQVHDLSGRLVFAYSPPDGTGTVQPGVHRVSWSDCGRLLFLADYNSAVRIFNTLNWSLVTVLQHDSIIRRECRSLRNCNVLEEKAVAQTDVDDKIVAEWLNRYRTNYEVVHIRPVALSKIQSDPGKPYPPRVGVTDFAISPVTESGQCFLASRDASMPAVLWIWDLQSLSLSTVLVHRDPVAGFQWEPNSTTIPRLMLLTRGGPTLFSWTPQGAVTMQTPSADEQFSPQKVVWNPRGKVFLLVGRDKFVCCKT